MADAKLVRCSSSREERDPCTRRSCHACDIRFQSAQDLSLDELIKTRTIRKPAKPAAVSKQAKVVAQGAHAAASGRRQQQQQPKQAHASKGSRLQPRAPVQMGVQSKKIRKARAPISLAPGPSGPPARLVKVRVGACMHAHESMHSGCCLHSPQASPQFPKGLLWGVRSQHGLHAPTHTWTHYLHRFGAPRVAGHACPCQGRHPAWSFGHRRWATSSPFREAHRCMHPPDPA